MERFLARDPVMVDIGCGPTTSALAFGELFPKRSFGYIGIDSAQAMRIKAQEILKTAKAKGILDKGTSIILLANWNEIDSIPVIASVLFNFAFFFASKSLKDSDLESLAAQVKAIAKLLNSKCAIFAYTNSIERVANENYAKFIDILDIQPKEGRTQNVVSYKNLLHQRAFKTRKFISELYEVAF